MTKVKLNIDKPDPPVHVIRKHKNFNTFMDTYQQLHTQKGIREMWYRDKKTLALIAVLLMLLLIYVLAE